MVIVNWNVSERLRCCLESLYAFTRGISWEVLVVDNNSPDDSVEMVRTRFPQAGVIALGENLGFSAANNRGIRRTQGRYVLLLNPDTLIRDNALAQVVSWLDQHPEADAVAPQLLYPDESVQLSCRHFPTVVIDLWESLYLDQLFPRSRIFNRYRMGLWPHDSCRRVDQPYGACIGLRREVFERVGLMDERFFMYYDEVDLCLRLSKKGGEIWYVPGIRVVHYANQSSNQVTDACEFHKARSRMLFFRKHYGEMRAALLWGHLCLRSTLVWGLYPLLHLITGRPRQVRFFQRPAYFLWKGYRDALRY